jgi:hypothetical protein
MSRRQPFKKKPHYVLKVDILGYGTCEHGVPRHAPNEKPAFCIQCQQAVRGINHPIWRSVKPASYESIEERDRAAEKKRLEKEDEAYHRRTFAERMHADRLAKQQEKEALARMTPEERADLKEREEALKALRKARKLRKKHGLQRKTK